ncbi:MAG: FAD-dependent oxidoreductase [Thermoguttaceae bacterium]|jgi:glutamate synthase (NADPH/NADH) small chain
MAIDPTKKVPVHEQDPSVRARNFDEVRQGYNMEEAMLEASRCLGCKKPLCKDGCPNRNNIPEFIAELKKGDVKAAYLQLAERTNLPGVCGRVCDQPQQCEGKCIRGIRGEPVAIGMLERFVADTAAAEGFDAFETARKNGRKVAVVGAGPAGLACAYELALAGCNVTIFEARPEAGGVLRYGIPEYRLPRDVVAYEVRNVERVGVQIVTDCPIGREHTIDELFRLGYEAVFLGVGAWSPKYMGIPGEDAEGVYTSDKFLLTSLREHSPECDSLTKQVAGQRVVVVGGGNVAMDVARTAVRFGARVQVVYRRGEEELPARFEEITYAKEEGIVFNLQTNPVAVLKDDEGKVRALELVRMELGEPDESGRRTPSPIAGSNFELECDAVVMALGTGVDPNIAEATRGLETDSRNRIVIYNEDGLSSRTGVYAGGDAVTGPENVVLAMRAGRRSAKAILEYLRTKFKPE